MANYQTRWLIRKDFPQILDTEHSCHLPYSEERITALLRQRNVIGMVVTPSRDTEDVRGHFLYELFPKHVVLLRLCVHPLHRREGVATVAIERLIDKLTLGRRRKIVCYAPDCCYALHKLLKATGLRATGVERHLTGDEYRFEFVLPSPDLADGPTSLLEPCNRISSYW